ncbi:MAG: hypothetical protein JW755_14400 [Candidatus Aminicenantes bacterium]|nr:hypothetical protein [Candidatus Aminicenantes bacterium]
MERNKNRKRDNNIRNQDKKPGYLYYKLLNDPLDENTGFPTLEKLKMDYIRYLLEITGNDLEETAGILAIPPPLLHKELKKNGSPSFLKNKERDGLT